MSDSLARENAGSTLYASLRSAIERGQLKPGQLVASRRTLQKNLEVSYHAVRTALERLEREGWIIRRQGAGTYVADQRSRKLSQRPRLLRLLIGGSPRQREFMRPLVKSIYREIEEQGNHLREEEFALPDLPPDDEDVEAVLWISSQRRHGMVVPPRKTPLIIISHVPETLPIQTACCDLITVNVLQGGFMAGQYMREQHYRSLAVMGAGAPGNLAPIFASRLHGFELGWGEEIAPRDILLTERFSSHEGSRVIGKMLRRRTRPEALFAASDDLAYGACHAAMAYGLKIGTEFKVFGFDGQPRGEANDPLLTAVAAPMEEMGRIAVRCAIERIDHPTIGSRRIELPYTLQKGDTA